MATSPTINIVKSADSQQAPTRRRNRSRSLNPSLAPRLRLLPTPVMLRPRTVP